MNYLIYIKIIKMSDSVPSFKNPFPLFPWDYVVGSFTTILGRQPMFCRSITFIFTLTKAEAKKILEEIKNLLPTMCGTGDSVIFIKHKLLLTMSNGKVCITPQLALNWVWKIIPSVRDKFSWVKLCLDTRKQYFSLYSWYYMPATVHKIAIDSTKVIKAATVRIGPKSKKLGTSYESTTPESLHVLPQIKTYFICLL